MTILRNRAQQVATIGTLPAALAASIAFSVTPSLAVHPVLVLILTGIGGAGTALA